MKKRLSWKSKVTENKAALMQLKGNEGCRIDRIPKGLINQ